jgi:Asp-tRNA(Asn)/Glu-tRNA(Gln) amidotransferase A subunit family amidase
VREWQAADSKALEALKSLGLTLTPLKLPDAFPVDALSFILGAEAAASFDHLTRSGRDAELVRQVKDAWPNVFRESQMIPAVEYLRANRIRALVMKEMETLFRDVDLYVSPTYAGNNLLLTNLTGHPQVVVPSGFRESDGTPLSLTFTGALHAEAAILSVARLYQEATGHHLRRPALQEMPPSKGSE